MNLKQWRGLNGLKLREIARILGRNTPATIHAWEARGVKSERIQLELKKLSKGEITNFEPCECNR